MQIDRESEREEKEREKEQEVGPTSRICWQLAGVAGVGGSSGWLARGVLHLKSQLPCLLRPSLHTYHIHPSTHQLPPTPFRQQECV